MKTIIIEGGIGRHIFFSALIPKIANNEKVILMSAYPDVYENNPRVHRSLSRGTPFAWSDVIMKDDTEVIFTDPYFVSNFIRGKIHVIEAWCKTLGIEYTPDMLPELYLPKGLKDGAKQFHEENPNFIVVQFTCGQSPLGVDLSRPFKDSAFERVYPHEKAQELVAMIKKEYPSLGILNFSLPNEAPNIEGTFRIQASYLLYAALLKHSLAFVGVNSCLTHMAAAMRAKGIALWGGSSPKNWGYDMHVNLSGDCSQNNLHCSRPYLRDLGDFLGDGKKWQCPDSTCMNIEPARIFEELDKMISADVKKEIKKQPKKEESDTKQCQCKSA